MSNRFMDHGLTWQLDHRGRGEPSEVAGQLEETHGPSGAIVLDYPETATSGELDFVGDCCASPGLTTADHTCHNV